MSNKESQYRLACASLIGYAAACEDVAKDTRDEDLRPFLRRCAQLAKEAEALAPWKQHKPDEQ